MKSSCRLLYPRRLSCLYLLCLACLLPAGCGDSSSLPETRHYRNGDATPGGTGRFYMEREIGGVMSHADAGRLDRPEREAEQRTDLLLDLLPVATEGKPVIADIGAGSGFMTVRLARRFPYAQIIAVDIQPEMLTLAEQRAQADGLNNISFALATELSAGLQADSIDVVLLVDSYHEFLWPREYMLDLKQALKPAGEIVIVEQAAESGTSGLVATHRMTASQIEREMQAIGLTMAGTSPLLPRQHLLRFSAQTTPPSTSQPALPNQTLSAQ